MRPTGSTFSYVTALALGGTMLLAACASTDAAAPPDLASIGPEQQSVICATPVSAGGPPSVSGPDDLCSTLRDWASAHGVGDGQMISVYRLRTDTSLWTSLSASDRAQLRGYRWILVQTAPAAGTSAASPADLASTLQPAADSLHPDAASAASRTSEPGSCPRCALAGAEGVN